MRTGWWQSFYDSKMADLTLREPRQGELEFLAEQLALTGGNSLFDQCCGWGRIAGPMASRGVRVYGVDASLSLIEAARERWREKSAHFLWGDAADHRQAPRCDLGCNLFSSFAYVADHAYNQEIVSRLVESVRAGGRVVIDTINPDRVYNNFRSTLATTLICGTRIERHSVLERGDKLLHQTWVIKPPKDDPFERHGETWLYTLDEVSSMLEQAGAKPVSSLGGFDGRSYKSESERLIVVAKK